MNAQQMEAGAVTAPHGEPDAVTAHRRKTAYQNVTQRGEQVGVGLSALATLLKVADQARLNELAEGESILSSLGCLVEVLGSEVLNVTDDVRTGLY